MNTIEKPVRLYLESDLHRRFRIIAAEKGLPMSALAKRLIEECVKKENHAKRA